MFQKITTILNLIAIISIPIIAVLVGQKLQDRVNVQKSKMDVFMTLMANRLVFSADSVKAMNMINVVFADDKKVRNRWNIYYKFLCIPNPDENQKIKIRNAQIEMLEAMAKSLGYKGRVVQESIKNRYVPIGMVNAINQQQNILNGQELLLYRILSGKPPQPPTPYIPSTSPTPLTQEEKTNADT